MKNIFNSISSIYYKLPAIQPQALKNSKIFLSNFVAAALATSVSQTLIQPFENIMLRIQISDSLLKKGEIKKPYNGYLSTAKRMYNEEGLSSFFKGNLSNILFRFPSKSFDFGIKPLIKQFIINKNLFNLNKNPFLTNLLTGSLTGMTSSLLFYPLDFAKTKISSKIKNKKINNNWDDNLNNNLDDNSQKNETGLVNILKKEWKKNGFFSIYRGVFSSMLCMFIYRGIYFGVYDTINNKINENKFKISFILSKKQILFLKSICGWSSTLIAGLVALPLDTIKKNMIINENYNCETLINIIKKYGIKPFYKGCTGLVIKGVTGSLLLILQEKLKKKISSN